MKTDDELQKDVMEEIKWDPILGKEAPQIGVTAHEGVVTLSGEVETYSKKLAAERAAQRVMGVKVVAVDLEVKLLKNKVRTDSDIAESVKNALTWHSLVNEDLIKIKVDNGWVYLDGTAEWDYQKKAAQTVVQDLLGVRGVTNNIAVKSKVTDVVDIKRKISAAFHRHATVDSSNVSVEVAGSRATLRGKVRSWAEKRDAEDVAWAAPGVLAVDNKIEIDAELMLA
jgi:osmotically-inducible protein OsmY